MNIDLSVIIVNYKGQRHLKNCFDSLYENLSGLDFEIIVFDNNSTDESCKYIRQNYPNVVLLESKINHGFGKGNNEAVKRARGEYLLLINNDTIVLDSLLPVLNYLKSDKSIGVVGINMLNANKDYIPAAGNFPNIRNMFMLKKLLQINQEFLSGTFSKTQYDVDWLGGSFLMLPKIIYDKIGGFDEAYFMYVEDVDFCKRIANNGYKRVFLPSYNYIHFVGFSKVNNPLLIKGYTIYISKHFTGLKKLVMHLTLLTNKLVKTIKRIAKPE